MPPSRAPTPGLSRGTKASHSVVSAALGVLDATRSSGTLRPVAPFATLAHGSRAPRRRTFRRTLKVVVATTSSLSAYNTGCDRSSNRSRFVRQSSGRAGGETPRITWSRHGRSLRLRRLAYENRPPDSGLKFSAADAFAKANRLRRPASLSLTLPENFSFVLRLVSRKTSLLLGPALRPASARTRYEFLHHSSRLRISEKSGHSRARENPRATPSRAMSSGILHVTDPSASSFAQEQNRAAPEPGQTRVQRGHRLACRSRGVKFRLLETLVTTASHSARCLSMTSSLATARFLAISTALSRERRLRLCDINPLPSEIPDFNDGRPLIYVANSPALPGKSLPSLVVSPTLWSPRPSGQ